MKVEKNERIAVVTGANRGIGFEICRQLSRQNFLIVLTSRSESKGHAACQQLEKDEAAVRYHPLDVDHATSIQRFSQFIEKEFGRCDVLVNNAGILLDKKESDKDEHPSDFALDRLKARGFHKNEILQT